MRIIIIENSYSYFCGALHRKMLFYPDFPYKNIKIMQRQMLKFSYPTFDHHSEQQKKNLISGDFNFKTH